MVAGEKKRKVLKVRIDSDLFDKIKDKADGLGTDISTYVRWCIRTGLYLENVSIYVRSKNREDEG